MRDQSSAEIAVPAVDGRHGDVTHATHDASPWVHPVPPAGAPLRARLLSLPPVTNAHRHPPLDTARCCQPQVLIRRPRLQRPSSTGVERCGHDRRSVRHSPIELPPPPLVPPSSPARAAAISTATTTTPPACLAYPPKRTWPARPPTCPPTPRRPLYATSLCNLRGLNPVAGLYQGHC